jgi:WD40 repeat protein
MGLVAHPGRISSLSVSHDGKYLFSAGGTDLSVNMWAVNTAAIPAGPGGEHDARDFYCLMEGGEGGDLHNDIIDYFYYGQLRAQGEDSMDSRNISGFCISMLECGAVD